MIEARSHALIIADEQGTIIRHNITEGQSLFSEGGLVLALDGPISGISFDQDIREGQIGTINDTLSFINWENCTVEKISPMDEE